MADSRAGTTDLFSVSQLMKYCMTSCVAFIMLIPRMVSSSVFMLPGRGGGHTVHKVC